mmetsp:Transcript_12390/g.15808  ORF Transcript_12390/g.15808 Transcript_12390/m.15808 type:complete len:203 (-) Transcript_12390:159-767(-)
MSRSGLVNVLASFVGADKGDTADVGVLADLSDGVTAALHDVDDAIGHARLLQEVDQQLGGASDALGRFQHVGVAEGDAKRVHPERDHGGEVVGGNTSHDTERGPVGVNVDAVGHILSGLALSEGGEAAGVLDDFVAAENISSRVDEGLAVLLSDESGELVLVLLQQLLVLEHVADTRRNRSILPCREGIFRVGHSRVELFLR